MIKTICVWYTFMLCSVFSSPRIETQNTIPKRGCVRLAKHDQTNPCTHLNNCTRYEKCDTFCYTSYFNTKKGDFIPVISGCGAVLCSNTSKCPSPKHIQGKFYLCCCSGHLCNQHMIFNQSLLPGMIVKDATPAKTTAKSLSTKQPPLGHSYLSSVVLIPIFGLVVLLAMAIYFKREHKRRVDLQQPLLRLQQRSASIPTLIMKSVELHEVISQGQFGHIYKGECEQKAIAIKVYPSCEKSTWQTERNVYKTIKAHENILYFYDALKRCENNVICYWIVTEYHEKESLVNFLRKTVIGLEEMLSYAISIAHGLLYLHAVNPNGSCKPSIAHCDFKSANVLVKSNKACCIGDFGSAMIFDKEFNQNLTKSGTTRYMAPEFLEGAVGFRAESMISVDLYAFGLVLWELLSRTYIFEGDPIQDYLAPYENIVGKNPKLNDMLECVSTNRKRPDFKPKWLSHPIMSEVCLTISECWDDDADARIAAHTVYVRFNRLLELYRNSSTDENFYDNNNSTV